MRPPTRRSELARVTAGERRSPRALSSSPLRTLVRSSWAAQRPPARYPHRSPRASRCGRRRPSRLAPSGHAIGSSESIMHWQGTPRAGRRRGRPTSRIAAHAGDPGTLTDARPGTARSSLAATGAAHRLRQAAGRGGHRGESRSTRGDACPFSARYRSRAYGRGSCPFPLDGKPLIGRLPGHEQLVSSWAASPPRRSRAGCHGGKLVADFIHTGAPHPRARGGRSGPLRAAATPRAEPGAALPAARALPPVSGARRRRLLLGPAVWK